MTQPLPSALGADPPDGAGSPGSQLPEPRRILGWMYIGRVGLALAPLALARDPSPLGSLHGPVVAAILVVVLGVTALSFGITHLRGRTVGEPFLYGQLVFDVLLLTGVVQLTGGEESLFAPLYILLICTAALLLSTLGGILVGLLGIVLYLASALWSGGGELHGAVLLQIALFAIVALVTGYLGERLRAAGTELGEVRTELAQLRLDTADILSTMSTGVLTVDGEGRLAYLNPAAEDILALPSEQWVGQPIIERLDRIAPGLGEVIARSAREGVAIRRFETQPVADDSFVLGVSTTLVERVPGERPAITAIFQDITEKVRVEGLRRRAERLEAVAELSASLAHEIKNPLASIRSAVEQIAEGSLEEEDVQVLKGLTTRESDRLSRLLAEFIDFARVRVDTPQPVDFSALVAEVAQLARAHPDAAGRSVELALDGAPDHVWIRGSEDLLHRAIFNLSLNALQWAGEGGRVRLTLDAVHSDLLSPALGALNLIRLTITDTGPGVAEDIAEQIFDPFFTRRSGGTGLGLALVQRAMEAHGGAIFVDNAPAGSGMGASFTVYLPVLPPELAAAVGATENEQPSVT